MLEFALKLPRNTVLGIALLFSVGMATQQLWAAEGRSFGDRIVNADKEPQNWLTYGRNYQETRHSPLDQINQDNVERLGLVWFHDLDTDRGQESSPLIVDGVIYTTSAWSKVQAFDGVSGKLLWQFDPEVPRAVVAKACCDAVNRGAAFWDGKVLVGTLDGRLIAIHAKTGKQVWSVETADPTKNFTITGAPRVAKGLVFIGHGGDEFGVRGQISAYHIETGKFAWRFYITPNGAGQPDGAASDKTLAEIAAPTWAAGAPVGGGGGAPWDSIVYDPELDQLYVGTGNSSYWARALRSPKTDGNNDNLFVASVVALKPETGEYVWHYQETPGDEWDYTSTQGLIQATLTIDGKPRKVLLHAPKNGFFYVIDRTNGKLISAEVYGEVNWATGIDIGTGRPNIVPEAHYSETGKPWLGKPAGRGNHNWQPMAYNPETGLVYIPIHINQGLFVPDPAFKPLPKGNNLGIETNVPAKLPIDSVETKSSPPPNSGFLIAWDPVAQKEVWRVPQATNYNGGVLSTAGGLLFQGDLDGDLKARDVKTGRELWKFNAQTAILAPPSTWSKDGQQYLTVLVGWGSVDALIPGAGSWGKDGPRVNKSRVLTFAIGGRAGLPPLAIAPRRMPPKIPQFADAATVDTGRRIYHRTCVICHGVGAISGGVVPDLRYSSALTDKQAWTEIVANGLLETNGMIGFKENFSPSEIEAVRAYVIERANVTNPASAGR